MSDDPSFEPPVVTDKDIRWASRLLKLPDDAFHGQDGRDPRQKVLKCKEQIDVAACPGSGKTTLLVAKLAILAEKWQYRTRGICVLSHTNAARHEIETCLGHTTVGRRLLAYPHYIGTIHGFVNEFLALPQLRSRGYPVKIIDNNAVEKRRRSLIENQGRFSALKVFVENNEQYENVVDNWVVSSPGFVVLKTNGKPAFKNPGRAATQLTQLARTVIRTGYHRHDEMFMWAIDLMENVPGVVQMIRDRFPLLFIDEAQDNSEDQSAILHRIFLAEESAVIRQRLGDENQAIFDFMGAKEATTDKFPIDSMKQDLPNSHRFGQNIANLADPLGISPYGLIGHGPSEALASGADEGAHTIFLFDDNGAGKVLDAYTHLLIEMFSDQELREGTFTAVGQVHRPPNKEERDKFPQHVGQYWPKYDPELSSREPKPQTFVQYVFAGLGKSQTTGETYFAVEKIAEGILRLAGMIEGGSTHPHRRHSHRYVLKLLEEWGGVRESYENLIAKFVVERDIPTKETWSGHWRDIVRGIANTIAGASQYNSEASGFLEWKDGLGDSVSPPIAQKSRDNIFRFSKNGKDVAVRVGSVHSVKGETHTATLVLETFWYDHNLESIKDWLCADQKGDAGQGVRIQNRLKIHYVAMTRPTHLLCLAIKRSTFENDGGGLNHHAVEQLESRGWHVKQV